MSEHATTRAEMARTWTSVFFRVLLILIAFSIAAWLIFMLSGVILLLIISIFFCYLIAPVVRAFEQPLYIAGREIRMPRAVAIFIVYLLIGTVLYVGGRLITNAVIRQVNELITQMKDPGSALSIQVADAVAWVKKTNESLQNTLSPEAYEKLMQKTEELPQMAVGLLNTIISAIPGFLPYLIYLVLVPIFAFFLLKDAANIEQGLVSFMPTERLQKRVRWLLLDVSRTLAAYIRAQITACFEIGTLVTLGLMIIGVPYALILGIVSGMFEFFPMIGPLMAGLSIFLITLVTASNKWLAVVLFLVILRIVQDYIIYPRIVGHGIEMHPLVVILAVFSGEQVYGLMGVFLSIPLVAMMMVVYRHYVTYRGISGLANPALVEPGEPPPEAMLPGEPGTAPARETDEEPAGKH